MRQRVLRTLRAELTWRHLGQASALVAVALLGAWAGLLLGAERTDQVGPLLVSSEVTLSLTGNTVLDVPPLGTIELDTHDGPLALHAQVVALDADVTEDAIAGGVPETDLENVPAEVRSLVIRAYLQALVVAVVGASLAVSARLAPASVGAGHCRSDRGPAGAERWDRGRDLGGPRSRAAAVHRPSGVRSAGGR